MQPDPRDRRPPGRGRLTRTVAFVSICLLVSAVMATGCATTAGPQAAETPAPTAAAAAPTATPAPTTATSVASTTSPAVSTASSSPATASSLAGTWDTGPYATNEDPEHDTWEWRVRFYEENGVPFVTMVAWDPSQGARPSGGAHGPYHLLRN